MEMDLHPDMKNFGVPIRTIESHAGGMAARVIVSGIPELSGSSMREKMEYFRDNYDHIRTAVAGEPRGHDSIVAAVLTRPCRPEADYGLFFIQQPGYLDMCGHGTIATSTVLVNCGLVDVREPITEITYDTPAGIVHAKVSIVNSRAESVTFTNVPAYVYKKDLTTHFAGRDIRYDAVYGGDCYAMIDVKQLDMTIKPDTVNDLMKIQLELLPQIREEIEAMGTEPEDPFIEGIEFYDDSPTEGCDARNVVLNGKLIDRSPCGTGTCAKLALLYSEGKLEEGQEYVNESFIGTTFTGVISGVIDDNGRKAVIPQVTGKGFVTGESRFYTDPDDELGPGFIL